VKRIAVVGLPYFGTRVASSLIGAGFDARFVPSPRAGLIRNPLAATHLWKADLTYGIGSSIERSSPLDLIARSGRRVLMHWVGSDVLYARRAERRGRVSARLRRVAHWADAPWLIRELDPLSLKVQEHPLPMPIAVGQPLPMPAEPAVLIFLPANPHRAYDVEGTRAVVDGLPEVQFLLVGGYTMDAANVQNLGFVTDMAAVYARSSLFLRLVRHDGLSHSVIEALSYGRQVAWNYELPGVTRVGTAGEAITAVRAHVEGQLNLNEAGVETSARYRPERVIAEATNAIEALIL
jgi:hypothetical protein